MRWIIRDVPTERPVVRNYEFKAELRDPDLARAILRELGVERTAVIEQKDVYYRVARGRLKRRDARVTEPTEESAGLPEPPEFIFYERPNELGTKASDFEVYTEQEAETRFGQSLLPVWLVVRKRRELWLEGDVRVHLDEVEDLGTFLEVEAPVAGPRDNAAAETTSERLRRALTPVLGEPIAQSYSDLMASALSNDPGA